MSSKDFKRKLEEAKKSWKTNKETVSEGGGFGGFEEFEDGRYLMQVISVTQGESQSSGRPQLDWAFKFLEGEYKDKIKHDYQGLLEDSQKFAMRRIVQFGYDVPEEFEDLAEFCKEISKEKPICRVRLKTKGEFQNALVDKVLGKDEAEGAEQSEPEEQDEVSADEGTELKKGMKVTAEIGGKEIAVEVLEILEKEDKLKVKTEDDKIYRITSDRVTGVVDENEVPEEPSEEEEEEEAEDEEDSEDEESDTEEDSEDEEEEEPKKSKVVKKTSSLKKKGKK